MKLMWSSSFNCVDQNQVKVLGFHVLQNKDSTPHEQSSPLQNLAKPNQAMSEKLNQCNLSLLLQCELEMSNTLLFNGKYYPEGARFLQCHLYTLRDLTEQFSKSVLKCKFIRLTFYIIPQKMCSVTVLKNIISWQTGILWTFVVEVSKFLNFRILYPTKGKHGGSMLPLSNPELQ